MERSVGNLSDANTKHLVRASTDLPTTTPSARHGGGATDTRGTGQRRAITSIELTTGQKGGIIVPAGRKKSGIITVKFRMKSPAKSTKTKVQIRAVTPTPSVSDGYFSDTDEEDDKSVPNGRSSVDYIIDNCKQVYESSCRRLKIIPRHHFLKQLGKKTISLRDEGLSRKEINSICASLVNYEKLFVLDFGGNVLTDRSIGYLCQLLERNSYITDLVISECDISSLGLKQLVEIIPKIATLGTLDISGNKFRDDDGPALSELIEKAQDLTCLKLHHNELRETGGLWVGDALAKNEGLEHLDLSWNHLRGKGAECIGLALMKNSTLTSLDLSWNGMGFEGCCALAHGIHHNTSLKDLDLTCNRIHPPALFELLKGVLCNKTLTCLRLGKNPIPASMTSAILARFRDAKEMAISTLDFSGIVVDKLFEVVLQEIKETRQFQCFYERALAVHKEKWENLDNLHQGVLNIDPLRILFFIKKNLRIIDLFRQIDQDHSASVSREEVRKALLKEDLPLSSSSMDAIMDYLDTNKDGEIDLAELIDGERRFKRQTIAEKQHWANQERLSIEEAQKPGIAADLGGQGARFSRSFRPDLVDLHATSKDSLGTNHRKPPADNNEEILRLPKIDESSKNNTDDAVLSARTGNNKVGTKANDKLPHTVR